MGDPLRVWICCLLAGCASSGGGVEVLDSGRRRGSDASIGVPDASQPPAATLRDRGRARRSSARDADR